VWELLKTVSLPKSEFTKDKIFFEASKILAKHDENYMPPEVKEALKEK